jgi:hypothetical protein
VYILDPQLITIFFHCPKIFNFLSPHITYPTELSLRLEEGRIFNKDITALKMESRHFVIQIEVVRSFYSKIISLTNTLVTTYLFLRCIQSHA